MNNWYLIYTKTGCEEKISKTLVNRKVWIYLPLNETITKTNWKRKVMATPLFPRYLFVNTDEEGLSKIAKISGVVNIVYWLSQPVIFEHEDIVILKDFVEKNQNISVEKSLVDVSRRFEALNFPVISRDGDLVMVKNTITKLYLPSLGFILTVYREGSPIEFGSKKTHSTLVSSS
ncbi:MAG: transcription termination/antitermination NusG family protein [Ginsengibacter sp.]